MRCHKCKVPTKKCKTKMNEVTLNCFKCPKCGEEYLTSSEYIKYEILTGKRQMIRKFVVVGDSFVIRIPTKVMKDLKIKSGDYGIFEETSKGILIKPFSSKKLK